MTVKELKEYLNDFDNDIEVTIPKTDYIGNKYIAISSLEKTFICELRREDSDGEEVVVIW